MKKRRIGRTSLVVSEICLGTMTFGSSCDEKESFLIMDKAKDHGINFIDTAELYPVPPELSYVFKTEEIVGKWLKTQNRDSFFIATKVAGPGHGWFEPPIRSGKTALDRIHIRKAVEGSLKRLGIEYIDLYQTHWPDHDFGYEETLKVLNELVCEGKIRYIGSSNETEWGVMKSLSVSEKKGFVRFESIQNNFSILNRRFEDSLADICKREGISLLPYSPLGGGVLSGKYNTESIPKNARFTRYMEGAQRQRKMSNRFLNDHTIKTTAKLMELAKELNMNVSTLAIAWSKQHDFVASTIIGASHNSQLNDTLKASQVKLDKETLSKIDAISQEIKYPMG